jgi:DNA-binding transcriptional ArsR family regulator
MLGPLVLDDFATIGAATHPVRAAILEALREPATAAAVARVVGHSRQNVAYHVRELEKAGLVRLVDSQRNGNFVERRYEAVATTFLVSPRSTWGDGSPRTAALADQLSLAELHGTAERIQHDCAALLDRAAFDGERVASASVLTELHLPDEEARAAFLREYVDVVRALARQHGATTGSLYRVLLAAYPDPDEEAP